jgi:hypothetical protein
MDERTDVLYHHCKACECIFKDPSCYPSIEEQKACYNLHENDEPAGYKAYFQRFLDFVPSSCGRSTLLAL